MTINHPVTKGVQQKKIIQGKYIFFNTGSVKLHCPDIVKHIVFFGLLRAIPNHVAESIGEKCSERRKYTISLYYRGNILYSRLYSHICLFYLFNT